MSKKFSISWTHDSIWFESMAPPCKTKEKYSFFLTINTARESPTVNFIKFLKKREIIITEKAVQQNWERASRENKTLQGEKVL